MKFVATYTETTVIERIIEANDEAEAAQIMKDAVCDGSIDLSYAEVENAEAYAREATKQDIGFIPEL